MPDAATLRRTATQYAETRMYDDVDATVVGMTNTPQGTRVGMEITHEGGSAFGALLGALLGLLFAVLLALPMQVLFPDLVVPVGLVVVFLLAYVGYDRTSTEYATVTVDATGTVVLTNRDCSGGDFNDLMSRHVSASGDRSFARESGKQKARMQRELVQRVAERVLFGKDSGPEVEFDEPRSCPNCGRSGSFIGSQFAELSHGQYQCTDCGHIVDLRAEG